MTKNWALKTIIIISICGVLFSGYLSYRELFTASCNLGIVSCGINTPPIAGLPACIYGFFMYLLVLIVSIIGYKSKKSESD